MHAKKAEAEAGVLQTLWLHYLHEISAAHVAQKKIKGYRLCQDKKGGLSRLRGKVCMYSTISQRWPSVNLLVLLLHMYSMPKPII